MARYRHFLRTGTGSNCVELELADTTGVVVITTNWMGEGEKRYRLNYRRKPISDSFGLLVVQKVEAATGTEGPFKAVKLDPEEVLLPLVIEYLRVPKTSVFVHDGSQLTAMRPAGYADWNETFELVLLIHDYQRRAESTPLMDICGLLDKCKLEQVVEVEEKKSRVRRARRGH